MKPGDERNRRVDKRFSKVEYNGIKLFYCHQETSAAEKYCGNCKQWVDTAKLGLFGFIICPKCNQEY